MKRSNRAPGGPARQQGSVAVVVALTLALMIGAAGLAIDGGRLYITKAELQTAADACALAAARKLSCGGIDCLTAADTAGIDAASLNKAGMQKDSVTLTAADISYSTTIDGAYATHAGGASNSSTYVKCTATVTGITPMLIGVLGIGSSTASGKAVATMLPSKSFAAVTPIAVCSASLPGTKGQWVTVQDNLNASDGTTPVIRWVSLTGSNPNANDVRTHLATEVLLPGLAKDTVVEMKTYPLTNVEGGYNTRFGIYQAPFAGSVSTYTSSPPDRSGYAYPSGAIAVNVSAYSDYTAKYTSGDKFNFASFDGLKKDFNAADASDIDTVHKVYGKNRRLVLTPVVDCLTGKVTNAACMLMLNPISNGPSGAKPIVYLEFRGLASSPTNDCGSGLGLPTPGAIGPVVSGLVQ